MNQGKLWSTFWIDKLLTWILRESMESSRLDSYLGCNWFEGGNKRKSKMKVYKSSYVGKAKKILATPQAG